MKQLLFAGIVGIFSITLFSCRNEKKEETHVVNKSEHFQCPMKCTQEIFDKAGSCPSCGMDLEKISAL